METALEVTKLDIFHGLFSLITIWITYWIVKRNILANVNSIMTIEGKYKVISDAEYMIWFDQKYEMTTKYLHKEYYPTTEAFGGRRKVENIFDVIYRYQNARLTYDQEQSIKNLTTIYKLSEAEIKEIVSIPPKWIAVLKEEHLRKE